MVRVTSAVLGGGTYPGYSLEVPAGWSTMGKFTIKESGCPQLLGIGIWDVGMVPTDPCRWLSTQQLPGPTVDDLVTAFAAQVSRNATAPVAVTLAGYPGT